MNINGVPESMDIGDDIFNLQQDFQNDPYDIEILDGIDILDILTSPGPSNRYSNSSSPSNGLAQSIELSGMAEGSPERSFQQSSAFESPYYNDPMFGVGSPMPPQAQVVAVTSSDVIQSERMDSNLADIEPMRLGSDIERAVMADPSTLRESLGSIELNSRNSSMVTSSGVATQRQAQPDSSQSQTTVAKTSNGATRTAGEDYYRNYRLPEYEFFDVSVKFLSNLVVHKKVTRPGGCLLHYQLSDKPPIPLPDKTDRVLIPTKIQQEDGSLKDFPWTNEKQKRFTVDKILQNFYRGLLLCSRKGNIYATRRSNTKLFWLGTESKKGGSAEELMRNEETEIFNWERFEEKIKLKVASGKQTELELPAVWISFAQKWDKPSSTITTKLVWARIDPTRACEMVKTLNPNVRSTEVMESLHSSLFAISTEPSQSTKD
ncbi:uncharacterized protein LOC121407770 [Lytechinus variegatus]|uniref:uncharacterized protein LOC121407770 n=1 Tax=Lytechinus variegatus TaxID=7654 RepID=UPI001BB157B3|nr:uncharacterized protein LOC121407770 [Lytechinus variegatus]